MDPPISGLRPDFASSGAFHAGFRCQPPPRSKRRSRNAAAHGGRLPDPPVRVTDQLVLARFLDVPREPFTPAGAEHLSIPMSNWHPLAAGGREPCSRRWFCPHDPGGRNPVRTTSSSMWGRNPVMPAALVAGPRAKVYALESDAGLSAAAAANFAALGLANAEAVAGPRDGLAGKGAVRRHIRRRRRGGGVEKSLLAQLSPAGAVDRLEPGAAGTARVVLFRKDGSNSSRRNCSRRRKAPSGVRP